MKIFWKAAVIAAALQAVPGMALAQAPAAAQAEAAKPVAPPPLAAFATLPALRGLSLSPNGERLLGIMNRDGNSVLVTAKWDGSEMRGIMETDNRKFKFKWARWVNNGRLIVSLGYPSITRGDTAGESRALAVDADGNRIVNLVPPPRDRSFDAVAQYQDRVIDWMPDDGEHVMMSIVEDFNVFAPGVFKVNVNTGKRTQVLGPRRGIWHWVTDFQHRVRAGVRNEGTKSEVIVRDVDGDNWRTVWKYDAFTADEVEPMAFGRDPNLLYVMAKRDGRRALFAARLDKLDANGAPQMTLLSADEESDLGGGLVISRTTGEIEVFGTIKHGDAAHRFWTEPLKELARGIDQALPKRYTWIGGFSADGNRYVVQSSGNGVPDQIYIGDRKAGSLNLVADMYPDLPEEQMVGKRSINFKARDGLNIKGYITTPKGKNPKGWPLVLLPHGGPMSRDDADFDTWTELLASRGYAVLQVNYRGSDGLGDNFRNAGLRRWGLEMQDDLTDGVQWAVEQKLADPKRVCVVGGSYGGYAALMGAVKTPDLYQCAVSFAGVSNLIDLSRREAGYSINRTYTDEQVGNYWRDRDQLKATSPSEQAAKIRIPVLLVHGTSDTIVPYDQSVTMDKALKAAGKNVRFVTLEGGDHNLGRQADRLLFFAELESFLARHLGATSAK